MAELVGDLPHIDKEDDLDFDMAERVERAEAACAAKDAALASVPDLADHLIRAERETDRAKMLAHNDCAQIIMDTVNAARADNPGQPLLDENAAKDAEIARLRDRTIRVCKCGCLVIGRLDHPCDKCASLDGTLIEVAWFDAKRELARLREALRHIANRLKDGGEWSYDHLCSLSEYATRAAAEDAKEKT